jgi:hypothetical protein
MRRGRLVVLRFRAGRIPVGLCAAGGHIAGDCFAAITMRPEMRSGTGRGNNMANLHRQH